MKRKINRRDKNAHAQELSGRRGALEIRDPKPDQDAEHGVGKRCLGDLYRISGRRGLHQLDHVEDPWGYGGHWAACRRLGESGLEEKI